MSSRRAPWNSPRRESPGGVEDKGAVLGVIAAVGAGVVLQQVQPRTAHRSDGAPGEPPEVGDEVGGHLSDRAINPLGLEDLSSHGTAQVVRDGLQPGGNLIAEGFIVLRGNDSPRLPVFDVQEDPGIIASLAPDPGPVPVHSQLAEGT